MSINNFIPEVWSMNVQKALALAHRFAPTANRSYEGEIRNSGDTVKINKLADPSVSTYTKDSSSLTFSALVATQIELKIDQAKSVSFGVDDVDKAQTNVNTMATVMERAGYAFANTADTYLAGLYAQAGNALNTNGAPINLTSLNVEDEILLLKEEMDVAGVPQLGRFVIIAPWVETKLVLAGLTTKTQNDALFANGKIGNVLGFEMIVSANVSKGTAWAQTRNIAGVKGQSYAYAEQILNMEALRPEAVFQDAIKGLHLYGGKIIRPDMTWVWYADKTAEA